MSLVESYHAAHKARLSRLGAPGRYQAPIVKPKPVIEPQAYDAGWESMWFFDLVTCEYRGSRAAIRIRDIQDTVCEHYGVELADLLSARRTKNLAVIRHAAYYLSKTLTPRSLPDIGRRFGRDHTTILYGVRKIEFGRRVDAQLSADLRAISLKLGVA
jgi:hypothetical protein